MLTLHIFPLRRGPPFYRLAYAIAISSVYTASRECYAAAVSPSCQSNSAAAPAPPSPLRRTHQNPNFILFLIIASYSTIKFQARILQIFKYIKRHLFFQLLQIYRAMYVNRKYLAANIENLEAQLS